ncbi:pseudouridylate synthase TRUB2, mitochondrial isoform X2 [Podarcis raffonei]|uniref:pseudouridylate synthase TRUB2, mitochondrial isoform X2 n=1 Tax=Podarcis raffonei TaxID=65483 RepID=UPI0023298E96|nr:pseudouridylate synthase TRUB2, mitochondrial isoform X2 [Podarcis raffonei]
MRLARVGLHGVFAVYKPPGVAWMAVRNSVETHLLKDLNSFKRPAPRRLVRFLPSMVEGKDGKELTMTVTQLPAMADHPLVSGPIFRHLKVGVGHHLDPMSSGVFVLGVGNGNKLLQALHDAQLTRTYTVSGLFGKATDDFSDTGKLIEKATFDHVTREQLERILSVIQGSHHKALLQPPPSLSFLPLRHYCLPREHEELKGSQPLSFRNSHAHPRKWSVAQSMGSDHQKPVWRVVLICVSGMAFLAWCALRRKTDIDRLLEDAMEEDSPEQDSQTLPSEQGKP